MDRPLISFMLLCYNHEDYIREAFESALAQSYEPLQIVVSDDFSHDGSYEIIEEISESYSGPHSITINRNPKNLGLGRNVNRAMELCEGELVIAGGGDDISLPTRTEKIFLVWDKAGRKATSLFSSYITIGSEGGTKGLGMRRDCDAVEDYAVLRGDLLSYFRNRQPVVYGCTHAWSKELFRFFGPLQSDLEDLVLSFRTLAIGEMIYIKEPLVKYRRHGGNASFFPEKEDDESFAIRERRLRWVDEKSAEAFENMLHDAETLYEKGLIDAKLLKMLNVEGKYEVRFYRIERQMMEGSIFRRLLTLVSVLSRGEIWLALRFTPRALPRGAYRALYALRDLWRSHLLRLRNYRLSRM